MTATLQRRRAHLVLLLGALACLVPAGGRASADAPAACAAHPACPPGAHDELGTRMGRTWTVSAVGDFYFRVLGRVPTGLHDRVCPPARGQPRPRALRPLARALPARRVRCSPYSLCALLRDAACRSVEKRGRP